ncbi:N-acyl-L-homoserine lactone synthetase [Bradyrhizobium sp. i1.3.1]
MMQLITPEHYGEFVDELAEIHRLRYRVFKQRLGWDVLVSGDMEVDEFDVLRPAHLLHRATDGRIQGCVRLLPSTGPTMLRDTTSQFFWTDSRRHEAIRCGRAAALLSMFPRMRRKRTGDLPLLRTSSLRA